MSFLEQLTHLTYQFGPFAFALIFLFWLARWIQKKWQDAETRDPPAGKVEKWTLLLSFVGTYLFGVFLAVVSVYWWWTHQPRYFYEGKIEEVSEVQTLDGEGFFARNVYYPQAPLRDIQFLIVQSEPFVQGQKIFLAHVRDHKLERERLTMTVNLGERPVYVMVYDEVKQQWSLQKQASLQSKNDTGGPFGDLISSALAESLRALSPIEPPPSRELLSPRVIAPVTLTVPATKNQGSSEISPKLLGFAEALQNPSTLVSRKIEVLNALTSTSTLDLHEFLLLAPAPNRSLREPMFVTLMDLTRHTDLEAAFKAANVLSKAPLPTSYFSDALASKNSTSLKDSVSQFLRLDPKYADLLVKDLEKNTHSDVSPLKQALKEGAHWKLLVPTGTSSGDRYYLKALWSANDTKVSKCVTSLSSSSFLFQGSKDVEKVVSSAWVVFDSDKFAILKMAQDVEKCGAKYSFVGYYPNSSQRPNNK